MKKGKPKRFSTARSSSSSLSPIFPTLSRGPSEPFSSTFNLHTSNEDETSPWELNSSVTTSETSSSDSGLEIYRDVTRDKEKPSIPFAAFRRLVMSIIEEIRDDRFVVQRKAIEILHQISEEYLTKIFGVADVLAKHAGRIQLMDKDFLLAVNMERFFSSQVTIKDRDA